MNPMHPTKRIATKLMLSTAVSAVAVLIASGCTPGGSKPPAATTGVTTTGVSTSSSGSSTGVNPGIPALGGSSFIDASLRGAGSASYAQMSYPGGSTQQSGIWVTGAGRVSAKPDTGVLSFGVEARETTVAAARTKAAAAMTAALKALKDHKVADKDIQTQQYSIYPIMDYNQIKPGGESAPRIAGYTVTNQATAKIRVLDTFGDVIDAVALAGGNDIRINNVGFIIGNPKPLEAQAREAALQDAMAKARQIAAVTGVKLGAPMFITESGGSPVMIEKAYARSMAGAPAAADISTPINPGESQVDMQVQMVFAIG